MSSFFKVGEKSMFKNTMSLNSHQAYVKHAFMMTT